MSSQSVGADDQEIVGTGPVRYRGGRNTMTTPTFDTEQLDIPETAVADRDATPRESRNGRIDTARFCWAQRSQPASAPWSL